MIKRACAVIVHQGRMLLAQRPATEDYRFTWECPSGPIEPFEPAYAAAARVLWDDFGLRMTNHDVEKPCPDTDQLSFVRVRAFDEGLHPFAGRGVGWFDSTALRTVALEPAHAHVRETLISWIPSVRIRSMGVEEESTTCALCGEDASRARSLEYVGWLGNEWTRYVCARCVDVLNRPVPTS